MSTTNFTPEEIQEIAEALQAQSQVIEDADPVTRAEDVDSFVVLDATGVKRFTAVEDIILTEQKAAAVTVATEAANAAVTVATEAAAEANEKATEAQTATSNANTAANNANNAAANAERGIQYMSEALDEAATATAAAEEATAATLAATEQLRLAVATLIPSALEVTAPTHITLGNLVKQHITAALTPDTSMQNVLYLSDNRAVAVRPDGTVDVLQSGRSVVHVVPTCNATIAKTVVIEVEKPTMREVTTGALRMTPSGVMILN